MAILSNSLLILKLVCENLLIITSSSDESINLNTENLIQAAYNDNNSLLPAKKNTFFPIQKVIDFPTAANTATVPEPAPPPVHIATPRGSHAHVYRHFDSSTMSSKDEPAVCSSCNAVISGRIVTALNKKWHPEHFQCHTCRKPIDGAKFHQHDGGVHCVPCFSEHHSPRCHGCGDPITDRVIQALGVSWHANHFVCGGCKKELGGGGFMEQAGRPYCSGCYADKFAARCAGCSKPITDKAIIALDAKWHRDCFTCNKCRNPVTDSTFSVMDNKPLCGKCA